MNTVPPPLLFLEVRYVCSIVTLRCDLIHHHVSEYEEGVAQELGSFDQIQLGYDASAATYPIVQTYWTTWYNLKGSLLNGSLINVTVTDQGTHRTIRNDSNR